MTLVDTNVLSDVLANDPAWSSWSMKALARCAADGPLLISDVIYAEMAARVKSEAELTQVLGTLEVRLERIPVPALFVAGQTFARYRRLGGIRTGVLPDFFVGAHALVARLPLLTRDVRRYRTYFPEVELIAPPPHPPRDR
jgi:predicted nucleic acid-binding protein